MGYQTAKSLTSGKNNVFFGYNAGYNNTTGTSNTFIGYNAGYTNVEGVCNIFIGERAGYLNDGYYSYPNSVGSFNTYIGYYCGQNMADGVNNVLIGNRAGWDRNGGDHNVIIGSGAGGSSGEGDYNVFLGSGAGNSETGSNKLYIENTSSTTPLIYGEFDNDLLRINGRLDVTDNNFRISTNPGTGAAPSYFSYQGATASTGQQFAFSIYDALWVTSNTWIDGTLYNTKSFQKSIPIGKSTSAIQLNASDLYSINTFEYTTTENKIDETTKQQIETTKKDIGISASELEVKFPALVETDETDTKYINYAKMSVILLEALKEQNNEIKQLRQEINELKEQLNK